MGARNVWTFEKLFSDEDWMRLGELVQALAEDFPAYHKRRARQSRAKLSGAGRAVAPFLDALSARMLGLHKPLLPGFPGGSYAGLSPDTGAPCIRMRHAYGAAFELANVAQQRGDQTDADSLALVWGAVLCAAESLSLGNVRILHTDWEDGVWEQAADWAGEALMRPMPTPGGVKCSKCSERRFGAALAWNESRALARGIPAPTQPRRARSSRI